MSPCEISPIHSGMLSGVVLVLFRCVMLLFYECNFPVKSRKHIVTVVSWISVMEVFSPTSVLFYVVCRDCVIDVLICVGDLTNSSLHFDHLLTL